MIDIVHEIDAIRREVGTGQLPAGDARVVRLRRDYDAPIDDVWDALTNPERIARWFLPVTGDFRAGGRYQLEGNAGGEIVSCERPHRLQVTWVYGDPTDPAAASDVEVRLLTAGEGTTLELEHTAIVPDEMWTEFGPGAVGVGWDMAMLGLALHLRTGGKAVDDAEAWQLSAEGRDFSARSSSGWGAANEAAGADPAVVARNVANTAQFYAPDPEAPA
jgi:uncharacterized protein YndB with AHSA1/START domain